jgi:L-aspartate oxidase
MTDFLVIGSGIAGLSFALRAAEIGQVLVITKKSDCDSATNLAQGGLAAVMAADDSFDLHIRDTLDAGAGLCDPQVVEFVVQEGPQRLKELIEVGARFERSKNNPSQFDLGREGGHSRRRVVHAHDLTGKEIERALLTSCKTNPRIELRENHDCIDLLLLDGRCVGAKVLAAEEIQNIYAKITVLCTGGAGKVYQYTCNPDIATGDGIAMAFRTGAKRLATKRPNRSFVNARYMCVEGLTTFEESHNQAAKTQNRGSVNTMVGGSHMPLDESFSQRNY